MKKHLLIAVIVIFSINAWGTTDYNNKKYYKNKTSAARYSREKYRPNNSKFYQQKNKKDPITIAGASKIQTDENATDNTNTEDLSDIQIANIHNNLQFYQQKNENKPITIAGASKIQTDENATDNTNTEDLSDIKTNRSLKNTSNSTSTSKIQTEDISTDNAEIITDNTNTEDLSDIKTNRSLKNTSNSTSTSKIQTEDISTSTSTSKIQTEDISTDNAEIINDTSDKTKEKSTTISDELDTATNKNELVQTNSSSFEDNENETNPVDSELKLNSKNTDSLTSNAEIMSNSVDNTMYIDGNPMLINFESINDDQKNIFQNYFKGHRFQTQTETVKYKRKEKNIRYGREILSLGLEEEELDKIPINFLQLLEPTKNIEPTENFTVNGLDTIAKNLERPILIVECKNGNICGFYEYGNEFPENRRKIILIDEKNSKQLVNVTDPSILNANLNINNSTDRSLFDKFGQIQINSESEMSTDDQTEIPDLELEFQENEEIIDAKELSTYNSDASDFVTEPMEVDETIDVDQNREEYNFQNWFDVVKRGDLKQLDNWKQSPHWNAYINSTDEKGNTAIMLAIKEKKPDVVKFFLDQKADIFASNENGDSALSLAQKSDNEKIAVFFEKYNTMYVSGKIDNVLLSNITIAHEKIANYRDILYKDFIGQSFEITDKGSTYKKYRYQCPFCSLGLTDEEQEKIPEFLREYSHKCKGITADDIGYCEIKTRTGIKKYDIRKFLNKDVWSTIADILQYRILIYEYNDRDEGDYFKKIVGFYEYGAKYANHGTKRIILSQKQLHYLNMNNINSDPVNPQISEGEISKTNQTSLMDIDSTVNDSVPTDNTVSQNTIPTETKQSFFDAIKKGNIEYIKEFIKKYDEKYNEQKIFDEKDENGTPLFILAIKNPYIRQQYDIIDLLLEHIQDVDAKDKEGYTILMRAVEYADEDIVHFLIDFGANINEVNKEGKTALLLATKWKNATENKIKTEQDQTQKEKLEKKVKQYTKMIKLMNDYIKATQRNTNQNDDNDQNDKIQQDIIKKYGQDSIDLVVKTYNNLPEYTENTLKEVTQNIANLHPNDISVIFTYAKNKGLLEASPRAKKLQSIIYRARRSRRWTEKGIANKYKIRDYDALIIMRDMPSFRTPRVVSNEQRTKSLSAEEITNIQKDYKEKYLSKYGILCKYHINRNDLRSITQTNIRSKVNINSKSELPKNVIDALYGLKGIKDSQILNQWEKAIGTWRNMPYYLQEKLKEIVDSNYKPKPITREYIEQVLSNVCTEGNGVQNKKIESYIQDMREKKLDSTGWLLRRFIIYILAQELQQKFYKDQNNKGFAKAYNMLKTQQLDSQKIPTKSWANRMYACFNCWVNANIKQRLKLAEEVIKTTTQNNENLLSQWRITLTNTDKKANQLLEEIKNNGFKYSIFNKKELTLSIAYDDLQKARYLKRLIQYIINKEKSELSDNSTKQEEIIEESSYEESSQSSRKRKADQNLVSSSNKTKQSSSQKRPKKGLVSLNKKKPLSNIPSSE